MSSALVQKIAAEVFVRRDLDLRAAVEADLKAKLQRFADENSEMIIEFLSPQIIEFGIPPRGFFADPVPGVEYCLDVTAERYRGQLPAGEDFRDWYVMRMEAKTVAVGTR